MSSHNFPEAKLVVHSYETKMQILQVEKLESEKALQNGAIIQSCWSERCSSVYKSVYLCFIAEIPNFLSEDECRVVMQLAQLKGLMESQLMVQDGQEELAKELNLSPEEIFNLLDINQDGQLQLHEVYVSRVRHAVVFWFRVS